MSTDGVVVAADDQRIGRLRKSRREGWRARCSRTILAVLLVLIGGDGDGASLFNFCRFRFRAAEALTPAQRRAIVLSRIRRGMLLSQEAKHNITAAEEACSVWERVLSSTTTTTTTPSSASLSVVIASDIRSLSKTLYASCLVRVGRDAEAISVYDSCLDDDNNNNDNGNIDARENNNQAAKTKWRLSKARCLQRLLKYSTAAEEYSRVVDVLNHDTSCNSSSSSPNNSGNKNGNGDTSTVSVEEQEARLGAATCILRSTGDVTRARMILTTPAPKTNETRTASATSLSVALLLPSCLEYLETGKAGQALDRLQDALAAATGEGFSNLQAVDATSGFGIDANTNANANANTGKNPVFLLYRWILGGLKRHYFYEANDSENGKPAFYHPTTSGDTTTVATSKIHGGGGQDPEQLFMELIRINTSPLDDPDLVRLDDKIELHNLLTSREGLPSYWPEGLILPDQSSKLNEKINRQLPDHSDHPVTTFMNSTADVDGVQENLQLWISKSRAGYGSHGNRILTLAEAKEEVRAPDGDKTNDNRRKGLLPKNPHKDDPELEPYLLQRMVDPLLLLRGYKFSLRIYVVYFSSKEAYISSEGLVKLASTPLFLDEKNDVPSNKEETMAGSDSRRDPSRHMTNSGRETVMQQEDLNYLWRELDNTKKNNSIMDSDDSTFDYDRSSSELWESICHVAANTLLVRYLERISSLDGDLDSAFREQKQAWRDRREELGIPKILGLDFVVEEADRFKPWLVEVNRFPGLEPRDEADRKIKYRVVRDAWKKASERLKMQLLDGGGDGEEEKNIYFDDTVFDSLSCDDGDDQQSSLERLRL